MSGTPSRARVAITYIVTASNADGAQTTAELILAVDPPPAGTAVTGVFRSDTVIGLGYVSGAHSGLTDKSGAFTYEEGQGITFSVGAGEHRRGTHGKGAGDTGGPCRPGDGHLKPRPERGAISHDAGPGR